jgi:hypothetical protein
MTCLWCGVVWVWNGWPWQKTTHEQVVITHLWHMWPALAIIGLREPLLAFTGLHWLLLAIMGPCWPVLVIRNTNKSL